MVSVASESIGISSSSIRVFNQDKINALTNDNANTHTETGIEPQAKIDEAGDEAEVTLVGLDQGPPQLPSILDQMLRLGFPSTLGSSLSGLSASGLSDSTIPKPSSSNQIVKSDTGDTNDISNDNVVQQPGPVVEIDLWADAGPGCGGVPWPAGQVLSDYLATRYIPSSASSSSSTSSSSLLRTNGLPIRTLKGKSVLELGSGTGLVGLVAARLGASKVVITDQAQLLGAMKHNVALNKLEGLVDVLELNWGEPLPSLSSHHPQSDSLTKNSNAPDIILLADCVYFEPAFPLLVSTLVDLSDLCTKEGMLEPEILFCYKKRRKADKRFFALLKKHFTWSHVDDDPRQEVYARDAISLFRLVRNRNGKS